MDRARILLTALLDRLVFTAASFCALAAGVAWLWGADRLFDIPAHFAPVWLAGGAACLLVGLLFPGRWLTAPVACVAIAASAALMIPEYRRDIGPQAENGAPGQLKVIQFNVWRDNVDPQASADWVARQKPDIVVVEEDNPAVRALIAKRSGLHATCIKCGVTIFSRAAPVASGGARWGGPLTWARFADARGDYTVVGVHYAWPTDGEDQQRQEKRLAATLEKLPRGRTIVAGDFNSTPWSIQRRMWDAEFGLIRRDRALYSWPAAHYRRFRWLGLTPILPIDHVYAGPQWATVSVTHGPRLGSDHYPVVMILAPRGRR